MVAQVTSTSPSPGPPYFWSMALRTMSSTLSDAMMRNGERPKAITRRITRQEKPPQPRRMGMDLCRRERSTNAQEAIWERTVAMAAPATSRWKI